jgi:hypothetical protein
MQDREMGVRDDCGLLVVGVMTLHYLDDRRRGSSDPTELARLHALEHRVRRSCDGAAARFAVLSKQIDGGMCRGEWPEM